jgi:hypothetical protein
LRESRIYVVDPAPIPAEELDRTFAWMKSWGFLDDVCEATQLIDANVQRHGYERAAHEHAS